MPLLMTIPDACAALRVGRSTIYEMIAAGKLKPVKVGRLTRIRVAELHALVADLAGEARDAA